MSSDKIKPDIEELKEHYRRGGLGDVKIKRYLIDVLEAEFAPILARVVKNLPKTPKQLWLSYVKVEAEKVAAETLAEVKRAMGIQYF